MSDPGRSTSRASPTFPVVLFVFAAVGAVDIAVIVRRKARGEPG